MHVCINSYKFTRQCMYMRRRRRAMYDKHVSPACISYMYVLYSYPVCMPHRHCKHRYLEVGHDSHVCLMCAPYMHGLYVCLTSVCRMCTLHSCCLYVRLKVSSYACAHVSEDSGLVYLSKEIGDTDGLPRPAQRELCAMHRVPVQSLATIQSLGARNKCDG